MFVKSNYDLMFNIVLKLEQKFFIFMKDFNFRKEDYKMLTLAS